MYVEPAVYPPRATRLLADLAVLGPASQVAAPGDYVAAEIAEAKVFAIRADDGELRAFRNVCVHRGARLFEEGTGHASVIQCPYHHWVYGLDGAFQRTPWFGDDPDFDMADWPLQSISVDESRGVCCSSRSTRAAVAREPRRHGQRPCQRTDRDLRAYRTERLEFDANWKVYTDNFVEGYHIPGIGRLLRGDRFREVRGGGDGQRDQDDRAAEE